MLNIETMPVCAFFRCSVGWEVVDTCRPSKTCLSGHNFDVRDAGQMFGGWGGGGEADETELCLMF